MNKLEIICYILSAFFMGIAAGCCISAGVHKSVYRDLIKPVKRRGIRAWLRRLRGKRKLQSIDEVHEHQDPAVYAAIVQGMTQKTRPVTSFFGCYEDEVFLPRISESAAEREEKERTQKQVAARHLLDELENAGAVRYVIKTSEPPEFMTQRVICVAKLDVVMPEKKEAQPNE